VPHWFAALLVALITCSAFLPIVENEFLDWDDRPNLLENLHYRRLGWSNVRWMYYLTNVVLHAIAAALFYHVAVRLLWVSSPGPPSVAAQAGAVVAALFFSIHPLRVESVAWATEGSDALSGLWFLLAVLMYLHGA